MSNAIIRFNVAQAAKVIALYNEGGEKAVERYMITTNTSLTDYISKHNANVVKKYIVPLLDSVVNASHDGTFTRFDVAKAVMCAGRVQYMLIDDNYLTNEEFFDAIESIDMDNVLIFDEPSVNYLCSNNADMFLADNIAKPTKFGSFPFNATDNDKRYIFRLVSCNIMTRLYDGGCGVIAKTKYLSTYKPEGAYRTYSSRVYRMKH